MKKKKEKTTSEKKTATREREIRAPSDAQEAKREETIAMLHTLNLLVAFIDIILQMQCEM